jgi:nucleotide-binding universal stress UspA family protein
MNPDQIVLATDFSPASSAARSIAGRFAHMFKAKVMVVHVFQYVVRHQYQVPVGWMIECIRRDVQHRMNETRKVLADIGVETEGRLIEDGFPAREILNVLQTCKSPLLVMGTHAIGGMDRFVLGSTAEEVLRQASCPVITVGPHVTSEEGIGPNFHKVLYATDFSEASLAAVPFAAMLRKSSSASLRVLHVSTDPDFVDVSEDQNFDPVRKALNSNGPESTEHTAEYVTLHGKDVGQAITNEAERYPADLLVLGVRRASAYATHLAPKIAFQVIAAAPCAVLTVSS